MPDGSYSNWDIQDCFEYIIKKHETITNNPAVRIYVNKIMIVFKIKTGYKLELSSPEAIKLLRSTKKDVDQDKYGEYAPNVESVEVVFVEVHCNLVSNNYQQASKVLFTFAANKQFGQLMIIAPHSLTMLNTANTKFSSIKVCFTD